MTRMKWLAASLTLVLAGIWGFGYIDGLCTAAWCDDTYWWLMPARITCCLVIVVGLLLVGVAAECNE